MLNYFEEIYIHWYFISLLSMEKVEVAEISLQIFQRFHFKDFIFNIMHADQWSLGEARSQVISSLGIDQVSFQGLVHHRVDLCKLAQCLQIYGKNERKKERLWLIEKDTQMETKRHRNGLRQRETQETNMYPFYLSLFIYKLSHLTHLPQCRIYVSVNRVSIGSDNGLLSIKCQAII